MDMPATSRPLSNDDTDTTPTQQPTITNFIMGHGKGWSLEERELLAVALRVVACDAAVGRNQTAEQFESRVKEEFDRKTPSKYEPGTHKDRTTAAVMACWKNSISPDLQKFNSSLQAVFCAKPSGCTEDDMKVIAVAYHIGNYKTIHQSMRDQDPKLWPNYLAWRALADTSKFQYTHHAVKPKNPNVGLTAAAVTTTATSMLPTNLTDMPETISTSESGGIVNENELLTGDEKSSDSIVAPTIASSA